MFKVCDDHNGLAGGGGSSPLLINELRQGSGLYPCPAMRKSKFRGVLLIHKALATSDSFAWQRRSQLGDDFCFPAAVPVIWASQRSICGFILLGLQLPKYLPFILMLQDETQIT